MLKTSAAMSALLAVSTDCIKLIIVIVALFSCTIDSTRINSNFLLSEEKSAPSDVINLARHKRAPGWGKRSSGWENTKDSYDLINNIDITGEKSTFYKSNEHLSDDYLYNRNIDHELNKRAPGWGKRSDSDDFYTSNLEADLVPQWIMQGDNFDDEEGKRAPGWGKRAPGWGKRAPGWGKRAPGWGKRASEGGWGKRAPGWGKRAPGWGKRAPGWGKRAPGWGKRASEGGWGKRNKYLHSELDGAEGDQYYEDIDALIDDPVLEDIDNIDKAFKENEDLQKDESLSTDVFEMDKRAPGWGKRAPGWGKRAPGWGKRAPGWGKRAPGWGKRAPGWGKRAPGWGKRAPGWGKRSVNNVNNAEIDNQEQVRVKRASITVKQSPAHSTHDLHQELQSLRDGFADKHTHLF